jgi:hypothetical protein
VVAETDGSIVLVVGTAPDEEIRDLAASLTTAPPR